MCYLHAEVPLVGMCLVRPGPNLQMPHSSITLNAACPEGMGAMYIHTSWHVLDCRCVYQDQSRFRQYGTCSAQRMETQVKNGVCVAQVQGRHADVHQLVSSELSGNAIWCPEHVFLK